MVRTFMAAAAVAVALLAAAPAHADDNRWLHRPRMPWEAAARRHDPDLSLSSSCQSRYN